MLISTRKAKQNNTGAHISSNLICLDSIGSTCKRKLMCQMCQRPLHIKWIPKPMEGSNKRNTFASLFNPPISQKTLLYFKKNHLVYVHWSKAVKPSKQLRCLNSWLIMHSHVSNGDVPIQQAELWGSGDGGQVHVKLWQASHHSRGLGGDAGENRG